MNNQLVLLKKKVITPLLFIFPNCTFINILAAAFGDLAYPIGYYSVPYRILAVVLSALSYSSCSARLYILS